MDPVADLLSPAGDPDRAILRGAAEPTTIALAGAEFGWGSSGKLSAVLSALAERGSDGPLRLVGIGSGLGRPLLAAHPVETWYDLPESGGDTFDTVRRIVRSERVAAALVVLDGPLAMALEATGVPTVFVDSLPFLWTDGDRRDLPLDVSVYCAQRCVELPPECRDVLDSVRALRWVDAIVATPSGRPRRTGPEPATRGPGERPAAPAEARREPAGPPAVPYRKALINLGGLRAPRLADWSHYPRLVVPAAVEALAAEGVGEVHIAGNVPSDLGARLAGGRPGTPRTTAGPLSHRAFLDRLAETDVLLTSPGLTTLLEADGMGVPTVCLPPQNLSQVFNGRFHSRAVGADVRTRWPEDVFAEDDALALRAEGEDHALTLIYGSIAETATGPGADAARRRLRDAIRGALRTAGTHQGWGGLASQVGTGGAAQVADAVLSLVGRTTAPRGPAAATAALRPGPVARPVS
ncbi:hydroxymethylcytosylglucuronate/cytosylglucuronate synthase [Streptomyces changanensis]|uniref:Hydroxymethylcytosylglucuronate/cytosylglucurona te synthase n=1 Tax=Streptomyces changanensis TaxID=2964669 RepID=A0ABY5NEN7_9ACTN|nr:hydroxymethylcytosylglucuronate/cytosylglucuronate synthase [Streptomyces changanensis]UUS34517.1 hydroxymethylcytosylglucuronate/cytosylglucuronate synthase [Streptomyces changanensis]